MNLIILNDPSIDSYSIESYLPRVTIKSQIIYIIVILTVILSLVSLPFIYVNVSVQSPGIIRPVAEKAEIRTLVTGTIDSILVQNGQVVGHGQPLVVMDNALLNSKLQLNYLQQREKEDEIHDLNILVLLTKENYDSVSGLISPLYRQQYSQFIYNLSDNLLTQKKLLRYLKIGSQLYNNGKVIALQELLDKKYAYNKSLAEFNTSFEQQLSSWQADLTNTKMDINQLQAEGKELDKQINLNTITAPVSGALQQFQGIYTGSYIQAGDVLGVISPDSGLIAECYVKPSDIGLIKKGMKVRFQVDAFNYNQWGLLYGSVMEISNDFITVNNTPVFIVRCRLDQDYLKLKNGYKGNLKKGMTINGRFIVARRSLYQLLYDKMENWLNPKEGK